MMSGISKELEVLAEAVSLLGLKEHYFNTLTQAFMDQKITIEQLDSFYKAMNQYEEKQAFETSKTKGTGKSAGKSRAVKRSLKLVGKKDFNHVQY